MKDFKSVITQCIAALVSVSVVSVSMVSITDKVSKTLSEANASKEMTTVSTTHKIPVTKPEPQTTEPETTQEETTTQEVTEPITVTTAKPVTPTIAKTTKKIVTTKKSTTKPNTTKKTTTTTKKTTTKPAKLTTAQIIANYNSAVSKAVSSKAGYKKVRTTTLKSLEGGALVNNSAVKGAVSDFLGVGNKDYSNAKGKSEYMKSASIKASDVQSASYTLSNGKYTYTIVLKNGTSSDSGSAVNNSPVDRSGILVGAGDKSVYDHKTAENLYSAINNTDGASVSSVNENSSNVKCVAVVNASSGKLEKLTVSFNYNVSLSNIKYLVLSIKSATGSASTTVNYSNFVW